MTIENRHQLENSLVKLRLLEEMCSRKQQATSGDARVRELSLASLRKQIKRFQEEIARFNCRVRTTK